MSIDYSYFPNDQKHKVGDSSCIFLSTGDLYAHNVDGRGGVDSIPCVFLHERNVITPVYKGAHTDTVCNRMVHWLSQTKTDGVNVLLLLKSVNWHSDPDRYQNPAIAAGIADAQVGRVSSANFTAYASQDCI